MPTFPLIAIKPTRYDGKIVRKGQRFTALSDNDARVLTVCGFAKHATPAEAAPVVDDTVTDEADLARTDPPQSESASSVDSYPPIVDPLPAPPAPPDPGVEPTRRRGRYARKDLTAQD